MLLRISLIVAILAGIGTIVVTQIKTREHIQGIINERQQNAEDRDKNRARYQKAEKDLGTATNKLNQTQATLTKTQEELNATKQNLAGTQASLAKVTADLKAATDARTAAQQELSKWEQIGPKPEQIRDIITNLKKAEESIAVFQDEKTILVRQLAEIRNKLDALLGNEDIPPALPVGTKATILAVDPKWNFVVLDKGSVAGLLERGVLMVHRNSELVGKVRIVEVQQNRSIANVMPGWTQPGKEIQEGDQAIY